MWIYNGEEITNRNQLPENAIGFVYLIENKKLNKKYIGKKSLISKRTRPPLKGYKRKRIDYVESKWLNYLGSNLETRKWNPEDCVKKIIYICYTKTMLTYLETYLQFKEEVLINDNYLNDNILGKFYKKTITKLNNEQNNLNRR